MTARGAILVPLLWLSFAQAAPAQNGRPFTFHGRLRDQAGRPITETSELTFRVYDASSGGRLLAGPFGPFRVTPVRGLFTLGFGDFPMDLTGGARWLEVSVRGATLPRTELATAYYDGVEPDGRFTGGRTLMSLSRPTRAPSSAERTALNVVTVLDNGPPSNRIDLVFVGDGYTAAALDTYAVHVENVVDYLFTQEPFKSYKTFFNVHRVDVISNESGVDNDPSVGIDRDTALDMAFWCGGTERSLCVDEEKARQAASEAPGVDQILALANSTKDGGTAYVGGDLAMVSGGTGRAADVAVHELGHSLGNLADEYDYGNGERYTGPETYAANTSILPADSMAASGTKWAAWLGDPAVGFNGPVWTFEGASYKQFGIYRPTEFSRMRISALPFNPPSAEELIREFYRVVKPIDDATPAGTGLDQFSTAYVVPTLAPGRPISIQWFLDGAPIPGATEPTFEVASGAFELGAHVLSVTVRDTTPMVRDEAARGELMSESRSWDVLIGDRRPLVTAPPVVSGLEETTIAFDVSVTDPDGDAILSLTAAGSAIAAGAVFAEDPSHASGTFSWFPDSTQSGAFAVTFEASNVLPGRASTTIHVIDNDLPPVLTVAAQVTGPEGALISFPVVAQDPDGHAIASLTATGSALAAGGVFAADPTNTSGTFSWTPGYDQAGTYGVRFVASNVYADTAETEVVVVNVDQTPVLTAVPNVGVLEGAEVQVEVYAQDPDDEPLQSLTAAGTAVDAGGVFTPSPSRDQGMFRWTPGFDQAGDYSVTFTGTNALAGQATTAITVSEVKRPPQVNAPAAVSGTEGAPIEFTATAFDPDGQPVESLTSGPLPPGAEFVVDGTFASGTFRWTPAFDQAGVYSVLLSTTSACRPSTVSGLLVCDRGTATVEVTVANLDRAPVLTAPATISGLEGAPIAFHVFAGDPDGEAIGSLSAAPIPPLAGFTPDPGNSGGAFAWTPDFAQAGKYTVTFTASNSLAGAASTTIEIADQDRAPIVTAPEASLANEGIPLAFTVTASDPDFDPIAALEVIDLPPGATFSTAADRQSGQFAWTPGFDQAGDYVVSFRATNAASGMAAARIAVHDVNRPPVANAGGPYQGVTGIPIRFDGSESSDPDGGALEFQWVFGDGEISISVNPLHAYSSSGVYQVSLTVRDSGDPQRTAVATTTAAVVAVFEAREFVENAYRTIRLGSSKPLWCVRCEPIGANFAPTDVNVSSVEVGYAGGSAPAAAAKSGAIGDSDRNGVLDLETCFAKEDLRALLSLLPPGKSTVSLNVSGSLTSGARMRGTVQVEVAAAGAGLEAALSPNPVRRDAMLTFRTNEPGWARVALFDLRGRRVALLVDEPVVAAGYHDVPIRSGTSGAALASGIYFYRVETSAGAVTGRFAVMK